MAIKIGDFVVEVENAARQRLEGHLGGHSRVTEGDRIRSPRGTGADELHTGHVTNQVAHFVWSADYGPVYLLQRGTSAAHRRLAGRAKDSQGLDGPGTILGHTRALPGKSCPRGRDGVDGVVLAVSPASGGIRAGDLKDRNAGQGQVAGDAGPIAPGSLNAAAEEIAVAAKPGEHRAITGSSRGEVLDSQDLPVGADGLLPLSRTSQSSVSVPDASDAQVLVQRLLMTAEIHSCAAREFMLGSR
jgi:hypothetical protein